MVFIFPILNHVTLIEEVVPYSSQLRNWVWGEIEDVYY